MSGATSGARKLLFIPIFKPKMGAHKMPSRSKVKTGLLEAFCSFVSSDCNRLTANYLLVAELEATSVASFLASGILISSNMLSISRSVLSPKTS